MPARLMFLPETDPYGALLRRVARLSHERSVLIISVRVGARPLRQALDEQGADLSHVHIMDAVPGDPERHGEPTPETTMMPGPQMLELIAVRADKLVKQHAERAATVVVDDVGCFALYAPEDALVEILHRAMRLLSEGNDQEYVVEPGSAPQALIDQIRPIVDGSFTIDDTGAEIIASR